MTLPAEEDAINGVEQRRCIQLTVEALVRNHDVFAVLFSHLSGPLERYESSQLRLKADDGRVIQLFLTLIRNLLLGAESKNVRSEAPDGCQLKVCTVGPCVGAD